MEFILDTRLVRFHSTGFLRSHSSTKNDLASKNVYSTIRQSRKKFFFPADGFLDFVFKKKSQEKSAVGKFLCSEINSYFQILSLTYFRKHQKRVFFRQWAIGIISLPFGDTLLQKNGVKCLIIR